MDDVQDVEAVLGSDSSILFKFGECFSQFFGKDDWSQIVKR